MVNLEVTIDAQEVVNAIKQNELLYMRLYFDLLGLAVWARMRVMDKTPELTGVTRDSWQVEYEGEMSGLEGLAWRVENPDRDEIVGYLEYGTRPHVILPVRKKALHWVGLDMEDHFANRVNHPGTRPLGIVRSTAEEVHERLEDIVNKLESEITGTWG